MGRAISNGHVIVELATTLKPYALMLSKNNADAEDLLQETICRALGNQEKFSDGTNLKAWLFTIMKNIFINSYHRNIKRNTIVEATANTYYLNASEQEAYNIGESNLMTEPINHAISNLCEEFRIPFMMHYDGFKYHEIADDLNLSIGTVKSRIFFARQKLKRSLET